jgi:hypothetical protein
MIDDGGPFLRIEADQVPASAADLVVVVPPGLATKAELLAELAAGLRLPPWFGHNWDALYDALCDLSHLEARRVLIAHADLPLADPDERATYLDLLRDALDRRGRAGEVRDPRLLVAFPPGT